MKTHKTEEIRNIGLFGHGGTGKTSLTEALLFTAGATDRLGKVEEGNTVTDFDPDEIKRKISISLATAPLEWKGHKINLVDTPGFIDFVSEVIATMRVVDTALIVVNAAAGVEVGTEQTWERAEENRVSKAIFVNRMDKENADFDRTLQQIQEKLSSKASPFTIPIGQAESFKGIVDVIRQKAYHVEKKEMKEIPLPADLKEKAKAFRDKLVELAAEADETLLNKFLETGELSEEELAKGLKARILAGEIVPVFAGSAIQNIGTHLLLDAFISYFPNPKERGGVKAKDPKSGKEIVLKGESSEPFCALVFKTMTDPYVGRISYLRVFSGVFRPDAVYYNAAKEKEEKVAGIFSFKGKQQENLTEAHAGDICVVTKLSVTTTNDTLCDKSHPMLLLPIEFPEPVLTMALQPKSKGDEDKLSNALTRIMEEDPTVKTWRDADLKQSLISGLGDLHIDINVERMKRKFGVDIELKPPKIPYRETIKGKAEAQGKYVRQTGGHGQYGVCFLRVEPLPRGKGFEFVDKIVGGVIPNQFIPSVEKGVLKAMEEGVLAGYPIVDIRVTLFDGKYHPVDSSDMAFQIAGSMALKDAVTNAGLVLMEPIGEVEVVVPDSFMGDIIGDLNSRRGRILGMEPEVKGQQKIKAMVPMAEMQRYATDLRSMTQGRGKFKLVFSHYEEVPPNLAEKIVVEAKKEKEKVAT
jgi:elongation factor G